MQEHMRKADGTGSAMNNLDEAPAQAPPVQALIMGNPVARAFAIIGDAWTQLILREAFYGARRFSVWRDRLNIQRSVLTDRLRRLVEVGVLEERGVGGGSIRTEYHLTEMGLDLFGVAVIQGQWERQWASSPLQDRYALTFYDRHTDQRIKPAVFDHVGGHPIDPRRIGWVALEGLEAIPAPTSRRRRTQPIETDRPMIDRSTDVMGDYWTWAVLAAAFFRLRRFDEIHGALGVATNILADRLNHLVLHGILRKYLYQKTPPRFEYRLTQAGRDLFPMIIAMHGWSERWLCPTGSPLHLIDKETKTRITPVVCDEATGVALDARRIRWEVEEANVQTG
jgi:DNA-binding HxlR family transcriptional regulator